MMKVLHFITFLAIAGCVSASRSRNPTDVPKLGNDNWISDPDNNICTEVGREINRLVDSSSWLKEYRFPCGQEYHPFQVGVVAIDRIPSKYMNDGNTGIDRYTTELFNHLGLGYANCHNGVMIFLSRKDGVSVIQPGAGIPVGVLSQLDRDEINNVMLGYYNTKQYSNGLHAGTDELVNRLISNGKNIYGSNYHHIVQNDFYFGDLFRFLFFVVVVLLVFNIAMNALTSVSGVFFVTANNGNRNRNNRQQSSSFVTGVHSSTHMNPTLDTRTYNERLLARSQGTPSTDQGSTHMNPTPDPLPYNLRHRNVAGGHHTPSPQPRSMSPPPAPKKKLVPDTVASGNPDDGKAVHGTSGIAQFGTGVINLASSVAGSIIPKPKSAPQTVTKTIETMTKTTVTEVVPATEPEKGKAVQGTASVAHVASPKSNARRKLSFSDESDSGSGSGSDSDSGSEKNPGKGKTVQGTSSVARF